VINSRAYPARESNSLIGYALMTARNRTKAQSALNDLKEAVLAEIGSSEHGLTNAELVKRLELESEYEGKNRNYLSWSILGLLLAERRVRYRGAGLRKRYITRDEQ
jgi:hypothetical protein